MYIATSPYKSLEKRFLHAQGVEKQLIKGRLMVVGHGQIYSLLPTDHLLCGAELSAGRDDGDLDQVQGHGLDGRVLQVPGH